jgi:hypothetical protein
MIDTIGPGICDDDGISIDDIEVLEARYLVAQNISNAFLDDRI